jgi:hypothetical protein
MRIYTVTCNARPLAVVRAHDAEDAIEIARHRHGVSAEGQWAFYAAREPEDAEMVAWLGRRDDVTLSG